MLVVGRFEASEKGAKRTSALTLYAYKICCCSCCLSVITFIHSIAVVHIHVRLGPHSAFITSRPPSLSTGKCSCWVWPTYTYVYTYIHTRVQGVPLCVCGSMMLRAIRKSKQAAAATSESQQERHERIRTQGLDRQLKCTRTHPET